MQGVHIIVNPVSGHGKAREFVDTHVIKLLSALKVPYTLHTTTAPKDAGKIGRKILELAKDEDDIRLVVAGGDGTAHELIEGVLQETKGAGYGKWKLAILPLGTANALHSALFPNTEQIKDIPKEYTNALGSASRSDLHALSSLFSLLDPSSPPRRLPITRTRILDSSNHKAESITSHIVLSTSLHAALLSDSEALRADYPGVERFKMAAEKNLPVAFRADVELHGPVLQYSPKLKRFVPHFTTEGENEKHRLSGPFSYFTSVTSVDRLEPTFVIAPTISRLPPDYEKPTIDIIVLRPERDPVVQRAKGEEDKAKARADSLGQAMGWAYQDGKHISMTYKNDDSGDVEEGGDGEVVCEVFRCAGFAWTPEDAKHERSHLICADGSIHTIPPMGKAEVTLLDVTKSSQDGYFVCA